MLVVTQLPVFTSSWLAAYACLSLALAANTSPAHLRCYVMCNQSALYLVALDVQHSFEPQTIHHDSGPSFERLYYKVYMNFLLYIIDITISYA